MDQDHLELLAYFSVWYYDENHRQQAIAERIGLFRSMSPGYLGKHENEVW